MTNNKLTFKQFWELSEIYTAPLNLFIILLGISSANFLSTTALSVNLTIFIAIIISFHIAVNIFNNWMDYQNAEDETYKNITNIIGRDNLSLKTVKTFFYGAMLVSAILGAYLVSQTNIIVGILGFIGFYIGLFYSYGKHPINSLPIAETVTAIASGFFITFISFYLMTFEVTTDKSNSLLSIIAISLPLVISMFNNLLANNTCDLEEDINNNRHTLVYYLGKKRAVFLLLSLTGFNFLWLVFLVINQLAPISILVLFLSLPIIIPALKKYSKLQDKKTTFPLVLKSMSIMMIFYPFLYFLGSFF